MIKKRKLSLFVTVLFISLLFIVSPIFAENISTEDFEIESHIPDVVLTPDVANCELPTEFNVHIENTDGFAIYNVKVYKPLTNIDSITCGDAPSGWTSELKFNSYCEYETDPYGDDVIENGESLDFKFDATIVDDGNCSSTFRISTLDNEAIVTGQGQGVEVNTFRDLLVDCEPPITLKDFLGPQKIDKLIEWIDGVTTVELNSTDYSEECAVGVDKVWYANILVEDFFEENPEIAEAIDCEPDDFCYFPQDYCAPLIPSPYEMEEINNNEGCINTSQVVCSESHDFNTDDWFDCVEDLAYGECGVTTQWKLYRNEPIEKDEESCHILQYFGTDHLNNQEDMNVNCFFVDKTPPSGDFDLNGEVIEKEELYINNKTIITLTCTDQDPHPSGDEEVCYMIDYDQNPFDLTSLYCDGTMEDGYCCEDSPASFVFLEDSMHTITYYCRDAVEKESDEEIEIVKVDSTPPITTKTYTPAEYIDSNGWEYIDTIHNISLDADDGGEICAVGVETIQYRVSGATLDKYCMDCDSWMTGIRADIGPWMTYEGPFKIEEESCHVIEYRSIDELGNTEPINWQCVFVDKTIPEIEIEYLGPYKNLDEIEWIDSVSLVNITAIDPLPHPSGIAKIEYMVSQVDDVACESEGRCQEYNGNLSDEWKDYVEPFGDIEESCHIIDVHAIDNVGKESYARDCVFVDKTAPNLTKTVGDPKIACEGEVIFDVNNGNCQGNSKTYTLDADFDEGILSGVEHDSVSDQLQLVIGEVSTLPVLWVANAGEDTLSKWDTNTNKEIARYHTWFGPKASHSAWSGPAPSRTAVDSDGNAYVANRQFSTYKPDVFKILTDDWIDRNGNGILDTSTDTNNDGVIDALEMLPMADSNFNGIIDPDEIKDERIAWVTQVPNANGKGRSLAIDLDGNIWLGSYDGQLYYKLDGDDGTILEGPISVSGHSPYGALVDKYGILWGASLSSNMLRLDTSDNSVEVKSHAQYGSNYGIAIGYDSEGYTQVYLGSGSGHTYIQYDSKTDTFSTPAEIKYTVRGVATDSQGNIIAGAASNGIINLGGAAKFAPNGSLIWKAATQVGASETRGTVVASDDNIWLVHVSAHKVSKVNGVDGSPMGSFDSGLGPYTYSDATGLGFSGSISSGTWKTIYDSGAEDTELGPVSWNSLTPQGTSLSVRVRSSNNQVAWSPWETISDGVGFSTTPNGRYLEIEVSMKSSNENIPILYDLTIESGCPSENECVGTPEQNSCDAYDEDQCLVIPGCNWDIDACFGNPDSCAMAAGGWPADPEGKCLETRGCRWEAASIPQPECDYWIRDNTTKLPGTPITLECEDIGPHPSNDVTIYWKYTIDGGEPIMGSHEGNEYTMTFQEDSVHVLDAWCMDAVNKTSPHDIEIFKVDSIPPVTTKTYNPEVYIDDNGWEYIDTVHNISLGAVDGGPICAVGVETIEYRVSGALSDSFCENCENWMNALRPNIGPWMTYDGSFKIPEESCHVIEYKSTDLLGNEEDIKWQCVFVDKSKPIISLDYGEPNIMNLFAKYISSQTPIYGGAIDPLPHPSGINEVKYRITMVNDSYCQNEIKLKIVEEVRPLNNCNDANGSGEWMMVTEENFSEFMFKIPEDSCHLIEIMATDNVGKHDELKDCVFVDNQAPDAIKSVGDPMTEWYPVDVATNPFDPDATHFYPWIVDRCWNGENDSIDCWKVTKDTPISMECEDPMPHPVGNEKLCFNVELDAEDATRKYCRMYDGEIMYDEEYDDDFCCVDGIIDDFTFREESEHNLKYYCEDRLGNKGEIDDEKFKVMGDMFKIKLNDKWNLISTPFVLLNDSPEEVFEDTESVKTVWSYDGETGKWSVYRPEEDFGTNNLDKILPGEGYWILADCNETTNPRIQFNAEDIRQECGPGRDNCEMLIIGGSLYSPGPIVPPSKDLAEGWNLIGYYGTEGRRIYKGPHAPYKQESKEAHCALYTLRNLNEEGPLWSALLSYWEPYNTDHNPGTSPWIILDETCDKMNPGAGYWIWMEKEDRYAPSTICDGSCEDDIIIIPFPIIDAGHTN